MGNWNNNYRNNGGYNNRQGGYNGNFNQGQQRPQKKHSGAKFGYCNGEQARPFVRGWKSSRRFGLVTYLCVPYKGTKRVTSGSGKEWENWMVKISLQSGQDILKSCLYNVQTRKVIIPETGFVINPSAPNGGYCGRFTRRK